MIVEAIEHLKHWSGIVIDAYREGSGPGATEPMTPEMAKALIWNEIQRCLTAVQLQVSESQEVGKSSWLRIKGSKSEIMNALEEYDVKTLRWLGPRNEGDACVVYAVIDVGYLEDVRRAIDHLEDLGLEVRDGSFGI
jgi:hypothetical protein